MNGLGKKIVTAVLTALLLTGCTEVKVLPARQNLASSAPAVVSAVASESTTTQAVSLGKALETPGQVVIYRKLGDNPATRVESVTCDRSVYQPEKNGAVLFEQWGLSKSVYVFIGWFYMDENNKPTEWTGDQDIPVRENEETPITAVFNIYYRATDTPRGGTLELYCATDGNAPVLANIISGVSDYPLPTPPDAILKKYLPAEPASERFKGWFTADLDGTPRSKLDETHVHLNTKETVRVTAVFS